MEEQRLLLAELMNPLIPTAKKDWRDKDVCKHSLVQFCPAEIFQNTKTDLGKCHLVHDTKLQKQYQLSNDSIKTNYERHFFDYLARLQGDVTRTIKRGYARLELKSESVFDNIDHIREQIWILEEKIKPLIPVLKELGVSGQVGEAMDFYHQLQKLTEQLENVRQSDPSHITYRPDKRMEVCDICGALLANDATGARIEAHMVGKQHSGYLRIRRSLEENTRRIAKEKKRLEMIQKSASLVAEQVKAEKSKLSAEVYDKSRVRRSFH